MCSEVFQAEPESIHLIGIQYFSGGFPSFIDLLVDQRIFYISLSQSFQLFKSRGKVFWHAFLGVTLTEMTLSFPNQFVHQFFSMPSVSPSCMLEKSRRMILVVSVVYKNGRRFKPIFCSPPKPWDLILCGLLPEPLIGNRQQNTSVPQFSSKKFFCTV